MSSLSKSRKIAIVALILLVLFGGIAYLAWGLGGNPDQANAAGTPTATAKPAPKADGAPKPVSTKKPVVKTTTKKPPTKPKPPAPKPVTHGPQAINLGQACLEQQGTSEYIGSVYDIKCGADGSAGDLGDANGHGGLNGYCAKHFGDWGLLQASFDGTGWVCKTVS